MSLLTAGTVKNSQMLAGIYFIFLENQTWKAFNIKFGPQWKIGKVVSK